MTPSLRAISPNQRPSNGESDTRIGSPRSALKQFPGEAEAVNSGEDTDWGKGAILDWDGILEASSDSASTGSSTSSQNAPTASPKKAPSRKSRSKSPTTESSVPDINAASPKRKGKAKANDYISLTDPDLDRVFTQMILSDEPLYLRVLRYEVSRLTISLIASFLPCGHL